jgi:D-mannonate dehydratase
MGKLWKIHFRNVSAPIPGFVETFVDNGYTDMKQVMRALVAVDFRGILIADHVPQMIGDRRTAWAFSIGYIKALYDMARDERRAPKTAGFRGGRGPLACPATISRFTPSASGDRSARV